MSEVKQLVRGVQKSAPEAQRARISYYSFNIGMATDFKNVGMGVNLADLNFGIGKSGFGIALSLGASAYYPHKLLDAIDELEKRGCSAATPELCTDYDYILDMLVVPELISVGHIAVGPSYTFYASDVALTPKMLLGYGLGVALSRDKIEANYNEGKIKVSDQILYMNGFYFGLGLHTRFFATHRWNLLLGLDYQNYKGRNGLNLSVGFACCW